jgi:hypothetical protein
VNSREKLALKSQGGSTASVCRGCGAKKNNRHQIWQSGREEKEGCSFEFLEDGDLREGMVSGWKREILFTESSGGVGGTFKRRCVREKLRKKCLRGNEACSGERIGAIINQNGRAREVAQIGIGSISSEGCSISSKQNVRCSSSAS